MVAGVMGFYWLPVVVFGIGGAAAVVLGFCLAALVGAFNR
jgi:hypothetical protein